MNERQNSEINHAGAYSDLSKRCTYGVVISTLVLLALLAAIYTCSGKKIVAILVFVSVVAGIFEYSRFSTKDSFSLISRFITLIVSPLCVFIGLLSSPYCDTMFSATLILISILSGVLVLVALIVLTGRKIISDISGVFGSIFPAFIVLGIGGGCLTSLSSVPYTFGWSVLVVVLCDTASYIGGKYFSGPKLLVSISPNKTWSGALSGDLAAMIIGGLCSPLIGENFFSSNAVFLALIVALSSQVFDLIESYLKRVHDVKDSSSLIPGHGGVFDRIDSHLGAAVAVVAFIVLRS